MEIDRKELKYRAREAMGGTRPKFWAVALAYLAVVSALSLADRVVTYLTADTYTGFSTLGLFVSILTTLILWVIIFGYQLWSLWTWRGLDPGLGALTQGFSVTGRVIIMELLIFLRMLGWTFLLVLALIMVLAPTVVAGSPSILLILLSSSFVYAGMIAIQLRYTMSPYLLADHPDDGAGAAVLRSVMLMRGHKWELFKLQLSFLGWQLIQVLLSAAALLFTLWYKGITLDLLLSADPQLLLQWVLNSLPFFLISTLLTLPLSLWLTPYMLVSEAGFYDTLLQIPPADPVEMPPL